MVRSEVGRDPVCARAGHLLVTSPYVQSECRRPGSDQAAPATVVVGPACSLVRCLTVSPRERARDHRSGSRIGAAIDACNM